MKCLYCDFHHTTLQEGFNHRDTDCKVFDILRRHLENEQQIAENLRRLDTVVEHLKKFDFVIEYLDSLKRDLKNIIN